MNSRRSIYDPLDMKSAPMWYVVRSMHRSVLEARALAPGQNLKRVFVQAMLHWMDDGWNIAEFGSRRGTFFCQRGNERLQISIEPQNPQQPYVEKRGWRHPPCPGSTAAREDSDT